MSRSEFRGHGTKQRNQQLLLKCLILNALQLLSLFGLLALFSSVIDDTFVDETHVWYKNRIAIPL